MKSQPTIRFVSGIVILLFLSACDPGVHHTKIIENRSDYDIRVYTYKDSIQEDYFLIDRHSSDTIFETGHLGTTEDYSDCSTRVDSIRVEIAGHDSLHVTLDLNDSAKWTYYRLSKTFKGGGQCDCRIRISNEDIQ